MQRIRRTMDGFVRALLTLALVVTLAPFATDAAFADDGSDGGETPGYNSEPINGIVDRPGFKWVEATDTEPAHYLVYNPIGQDYSASHEACIGWWYFANYSRTYDFDGYLIRLDSDLDFSEYNFDRDSSGRKQLSVGSSDLPFKGTFDGQSHTISKLENERDGLLVVADCGFFGWTNQAVIKNVNFSDCYVGASFRAGLVVGSAQDTLLLNILCENCITSVVPGNNVVNLITNAGLMGGMIAGETNGSTLYNCEMRAGRVVCNATSGVAALGGQPLFLGGLVGAAQDTVIEYSRVTDRFVESDDGTYEFGGKKYTREYAQVSNRYENAVDVASYSEVFTGGIVGMMQAEDSGSKVVDCYSTADCYSKAAIYFAVGLGLGVTRGYTGGIVGMVRDAADESASLNLIERVSYAGNLHSYNYNVVLLGIPAIETDRYMGGIVGRGCENATVTDAYFMRSASSTDVEILALREGLTYSSGYADGADFGPRDSQYAERDFWEGEGFDFAGGTLRNYGYEFTKAAQDSEWASDHYNKWVMDYNRGIPVHGGSIKATLDAPGAGSVTIGTTGLASDADDMQTTADPYDFAVQGYLANDESIELTYERAVAPEAEDDDYTEWANAHPSWAADATNQGYRFRGWYLQRGVQRNDIPEQHSLFTKPTSILNATGAAVISDENRVGDEPTDGGLGNSYILTVNKPDTEDPESGEYADNDLYVAYIQMQVLLHDVNGAVLTHNDNGGYVADGSTEGASDNWYDYEGTFVLPSETPDEDQNGTFIGWTSRANTDTNGNDVGYGSIDSGTLTNLRNAGLFWEPGDTFVVTEPTNLYPVYSMYNNIYVIYEGHDATSGDSTDYSTRVGYGSAVKYTEDGDLLLAVEPSSESPLVSGTVRFLGWYEYVGETMTVAAADSDPNNWVRVSLGEQTGDVAVDAKCFTHNLSNTDTDLNEVHIYKARFEYRVDYWACMGPRSDDTWGIYARVWHTYGQAFSDIAGPQTDGRAFLHWQDASHTSGLDITTSKGLWSCGGECSRTGYSGPITAPLAVYAHHASGDENQDIFVTSDFPEIVKALSHTTYGILNYEKLTVEFIDDNESKFVAWQFQRNDHPDSFQFCTDNSLSWETGKEVATGIYKWWAEAHLQAKVTFHAVPDPSGVMEVYRTREQRVFLDSSVTNSYTWHYSRATAPFTSTSDASPSDESMVREELIFLGWVDKSDPAVTDAEWSYALGAETVEGVDDAYLVDDIARVEPYLMSGEETCTRPMDLYPVYAKFGIETTTNIAQAEVEEGYNVPDDPGIADALTDSSLPTVSVNYNADNGTLVSGATSPVSLHYDANGTAQIKLTVDTDVKLKDESDDMYTFVSLTVSEDGVVSTLTPEQGGTFNYTVQAGKEYVFTANYEPVPVTVTYHLKESGDDATDVFSVGVGDPLPMTSKTPSFSNATGFFVGWMEGAATGGPVVWSEDVNLISTKDIVQHSMHLWPVYRTANVTVNSNIDNVIQDAGKEPEAYRFADSSDDVVTLTAKDYPGYEFTGWYTGYKSDGDKGTQLTSSKTYALTGDARFEGVTYTAVYQPVYEVRYHTVDGSFIYTAKVAADSDRKFLQTVKIEDPDKPNEQIEVQIPVDLEAFTAIANDLNNRGSDENADSVETFVTWQWVKSDGSTERWDANDQNNFVNRKVTESAGDSRVMDLYPVTDRLQAFKPDGTNYTSKLTWSTGSADEGGDASKAPINVAFTETYDQPWLKVTAFRVAYGPGESSTGASGDPTPENDRPVFGYRSAYDVAPVAQGTTGDDEAGAKLEPNLADQGYDGVAYLEFPDSVLSTGALKITKTTADASADGKTFYFEVVSTGADDGEKVSVTVPVTASQTVSGDGTTTYSGTAVVTLPYGSYRITEDTQWAWRYAASPSSADVTVTFAGYDDSGTTVKPVDVAIANTRANGSWIDGEDYRHNVFGASSSGGE